VRQTLLPSLANALQTALGGPSAHELTGPILAAMTPIGLVTLLRDNGLISFRQDPIDYGYAELAAAATDDVPVSATP
jgi:hypothetical protein